MIQALNFSKISLLQIASKPTKEKEAIKIDFIEGIKKNDQKVIKIIYKQFLPMIIDFVKKNSGTELEARDIFQDGLVVIYKKIKSGNFELTSSFQTYLFSVCRFVWLRELKKKYRQEMPLEEAPEPSVSQNFEKEWSENEKQKLFKSKLNCLSEDSRKVLTMFFNKKSLKEIAEEMGYTEAYAKRKKYKAKEQLVNLIKKDPMYQMLLD